MNDRTIKDIWKAFVEGQGGLKLEEIKDASAS